MNTRLRSTGRAGRMGVALTGLLLVASLLPMGLVSVVLGAASVTVITGSPLSISADTAANATTPAWTPLTGPAVTESSAGQLVNAGSVVLTAPAGFEFRTFAAGGAPAATIGGTSCPNTMTHGAVTTPSATTVSVTITAQSNTNPCQVTFSGIQVRPTTGSPLPRTGNITNTGTTGPAGATSYGTLTMIAGTAAKLAFVQQPNTTPANTNFVAAQQPIVKVTDQFGNDLDLTSSLPFNIALATTTKPGGTGDMTCTSGLTVSAAVASGQTRGTFSGCKMPNTGLAYVITASTTLVGVASKASNPFDIPDNLGFETQPGGGLGTGSKAQGGIAFTNQPKVTVRAGSANFTTNKATNDTTTVVTLSIKSGTGTAGAILTCDQASNALKVTGGSAQFTGCKIDKAGTGYQLIATSVPAYGTNAWTSTAFDVVAGPASKLTFTTQPAGAAAGQAFTTQPVIAITDAGGNVATTGVSANVTLTIGTNPGVPAGVLTCTPSQTVATATTGLNAGKAVFSGCKIGNSGVGYTLVASVTSVVCAAGACATPGVLSPATSSAFTVTSPAAQITLTPSASVITWGGTVVLTTRFLVNGAGKTFLLQGARDGVNWTTIQTLITDVNGNSSYAYRPVTNLFYKVVFAGTSDLIAGTSNTTRTVVRQIANLRPTNFGAIKSIARNTSIKFTTTVRPSRPELPAAKVSFVFYRQIGGVWTFIAKRDVYINSLGLASWTWKFSTAGSWYVRAIANPTPYNANSVWSRLERYTVR